MSRTPGTANLLPWTHSDPGTGQPSVLSDTSTQVAPTLATTKPLSPRPPPMTPVTYSESVATSTSRVKASARINLASFLCQGSAEGFRCFSADLGVCLYGAGGHVMAREYNRQNPAGFCVGKRHFWVV